MRSYRDRTAEALRLQKVAVSSLLAELLSGGLADSSDSCTPKRQKSHVLPASFAALPPGQRQVAEALVGWDAAPTYQQAANRAGVGLGTLHRYLKRIRERRPEVYVDLIALRGRQLRERHEEAVRRAELRSQRWHKRQANRRYRARFGRWPWER